MAAVADEDLVQGEQPRAAVELGLHHGAPLERHLAGGAGGQEGAQVPHPGPGEDAVVEVGRRVDADDRLAVQVLGDVGHEPVLPHRHHDVLGGEQEAVEIGTPHQRLSPVQGHAPAGLGQHRVELRVAGLDLGDRLPAALQEEPDLAARRVPGDEQLVIGVADHEDHAGRRGRHGAAPQRAAAGAGSAPRTSPRTAASRSGVTLRCSIVSSLPASSRAASPSSTAGGMSR